MTRVLVLVLVLVAARFASAEPDRDVTAHDHASRGVSLLRGDAVWRYRTIEDTGAAPAAWPLALDTPSPGSGAGDKAPRGEGARGRGTLHPDGSAHRIAAMYAQTSFVLGREHEGMRMLEIRLRYRDACAVWLDGIEVARSALPRGAPTEPAPRGHGHEWETFYVPVAPGMLRLGENTLAVEVRPTSKRDAPELSAEVIGRRELGIVRGPVITDLGATTATIEVETDPGAEAAIDWGSAAALDHRATSPAGAHHRFVLADLPEHARTAYRIHAGAMATPALSLHTLPVAGDVVRIGVYGDVRGGHDMHRRLVESMLGEGLDLVAVTGDMVVRGSDEADWQQFFAVTRELLAQVRYLPALGNHDLGWRGGFTLPPAPAGRPPDAYWYSFDLADVHLVFLDSNAYERAEQEQWLEDDLAAARGRHVRAIVAFTHAGPYARGMHRGNAIARDRYVPILARHHVDLLLAGHDHLYQRGEAGGIRYVVSGGGGAGLYQVSCGVEGKPRCPDDGMQKVMVEHHYVVLSIEHDALAMCPRRADGSLLEPCVRYRLWRE